MKQGVIVTAIGLIGLHIVIDLDTTPKQVATAVQTTMIGEPWYDAARGIDHRAAMLTTSGWLGQEFVMPKNWVL